MNRSLMALVLAAALVGSLTACTRRDRDPADGSVGQNAAGSSVQNSVDDNVNNAGGSNVDGSANSGSMGSGVTAEGPAGSVYSNGKTNYSRQSTVGQRTGTGNPVGRDGRYWADDNGMLNRSKTDGRGLTDMARDLVRGTENTLRDVDGGMKNAARDVTGR